MKEASPLMQGGAVLRRIRSAAASPPAHGWTTVSCPPAPQAQPSVTRLRSRPPGAAPAPHASHAMRGGLPKQHGQQVPSSRAQQEACGGNSGGRCIPRGGACAVHPRLPLPHKAASPKLPLPYTIVPLLRLHSCLLGGCRKPLLCRPTPVSVLGCTAARGASRCLRPRAALMDACPSRCPAPGAHWPDTSLYNTHATTSPHL